MAGFTADDFEGQEHLAGFSVVHLGFVADPRKLCNNARVFLEPTRFATGSPYKIHEAAAEGLPVMTTTLLAQQFGWEPGQHLIACAQDDPETFASMLIQPYLDSARWRSIRAAALQRIRSDSSRKLFEQTLATILRSERQSVAGARPT